MRNLKYSESIPQKAMARMTGAFHYVYWTVALSPLQCPGMLKTMSRPYAMMLTGEIHIEINLNKRCSYETVLSSGQELTKQRVKNKSMMLNNNEEKDRSGDNISSSTHLIMY